MTPPRHRPAESLSASLRWLRRTLAWGCIGWLGLAVAGCAPTAPETDNDTDAGRQPSVSTVPLRIVSTATDEFNQRLERAWEAVSEQPLEITPATTETLREESERTDLVLFRNAEMGELQTADLLTPLPEPFMESEGVASDSFLPGLIHGSMKWGDAFYALPLGTTVPAVWIAPDVEAPDSLNWKQYSDLVASVPTGEAAEPLAEGWAAVALLSRAASLTSDTWLFDRNTLRPVIEDPPYLRALEQLVAARQHYPETLLTPEQVWQRLTAGELQIAIGWPASGGSGQGVPSGAVRMLPYPVGEEVFIGGWKPAESISSPHSVSPRGLMVAIAASCRQTSAARSLMTWLASREGHAAVRTASSEIAANRVGMQSDALGGLPVMAEGNLARGSYDEYVIQTLSDGRVRPSLRLPGSDAYLAALDAQVRLALAGDLQPAEALAAVANEWESVTDGIGREKQLRAWRQAQGFRGR